MQHTNVFHLFLSFFDELGPLENCVSPCLKAPRVTPLFTKMLVTPILETCKIVKTKLKGKVVPYYNACMGNLYRFYITILIIEKEH
ncbi:hypothetical protein Hanom_Chr12g01148051 [Helianthus anomalus]